MIKRKGAPLRPVAEFLQSAPEFSLTDIFFFFYNPTSRARRKPEKGRGTTHGIGFETGCRRPGPPKDIFYLSGHSISRLVQTFFEEGSQRCEIGVRPLRWI